MACRDLKKAENAAKDIKNKNPNAKIVIMELDLSSLKSVRNFAEEVSKQESVIDILINNAGVMMCPEWQTEDGYEMQFGTNYLGINFKIVFIKTFYVKIFLIFRTFFVNFTFIEKNAKLEKWTNNKCLIDWTHGGKNIFR
jgi:NAD(P)-dependent dehydrogenase (short-subunit alcohol dehydrogenase family)